MKHIEYPSIEQFRNVCKQVKTGHKGPGLPTLTFSGTVKIHGTNASVVSYEGFETIVAQSRNNIITPEADNYGFAKFVHNEENTKYFQIMFKALRYLYSDEYNIIIYGEWCGPGIQDGVAIDQIPNRIFVIFNVGIVKKDDDVTVDGRLKVEWLDRKFIADIQSELSFQSSNIFNILQFENYTIKVDFNQPELVQNKLIEYTTAIEKECPVAKHFGVVGIGEGVVWECIERPELKFKVKGEKHSSSKVKTLASVDVEKINSIREFVSSVVTESRLTQGFKHLQETGVPMEQSSVGLFIKWVNGDIFKEEQDTIIANGLSNPEVAKHASNISRTWFFERLNKIL
jgi:hypothetical protein